ncbi:hypothetical protein M514_17988 [Trichuris suis]|uniref:Uncharacterized protein n=1 Tax=Trichuris suis TaxID=68888 RepID=A0A085NK70_9BILA|nr:hypothetical protein M514_17988 [Trichuris suis]
MTACASRRNTFRGGIVGINRDSSGGSGQGRLKTFWKGFTILDAIENIRDSWEEIKMSTLKGVWKKLIPTLTDDSERLEGSVEEVTADVIQIRRKLELQIEPKGVNELLQSHDVAFTDEELLFIDEQRRLFLELEYETTEDSMNTAEMTTKDLTALRTFSR